MISFSEKFESISNDFITNKIESNQIGFYNHPNFIKIEEKYPEYLNNYARFVQENIYSEQYLEKARREIPIIVDSLYNELALDERKGACVDIANILSKILEKEGYWNFLIKGSLTIQFPKKSRIDDRYFWSVDTNDVVAGHAWVYAPPFKIIDITVKQQEYSNEEFKYLPKLVVSEKYTPVNFSLEDIVSPTVRNYLFNRGIPKEKQLMEINPIMIDFINTFESLEVINNETKLKYIPVACGVADCEIEDMQGFSNDSKSANEIYINVVLPELVKYREKS